MPLIYELHKKQYNLGDRLLEPAERVVVPSIPSLLEARRFGKHCGLARDHPSAIMRIVTFDDDEINPKFTTAKCLDPAFAQLFARYRENYGPENEPKYGYGLRGKTVYIVHNLTDEYTPQDISTRIEMIARTAKYQGAENVVLVAYTLNYSAQERSVHDIDHPRMRTTEHMRRYDGEAPTIALAIEKLLIAGVDKIITVHNHCPNDIAARCDEANALYESVAEKAAAVKSNMCFKIGLAHVDLAPMLGYYITDESKQHLGFDISDGGSNILIVGPDSGISDFLGKVMRYIHMKLPNAASAILDKTRVEGRSDIERLVLKETTGINPERGIAGMHVCIIDDVARSGKTLGSTVDVLMNGNYKGVERDPSLKGDPAQVAAYVTRTNGSPDMVMNLSRPSLSHFVTTNADARVLSPTRQRELSQKLQILWINFLLAQAAMAVEAGEDPNVRITPELIRENALLRIEKPHGHKARERSDRGII
jgi:phosphoribosylpyrophosphate synthetase